MIGKEIKRKMFNITVFLLYIIVTGTIIYPGHLEASETKVIKRMEIIKDTIWSGKYVITDAVSVAADIILKVEEGTKIFFQGEAARLIVHGGLLVDGSEGKPVLFSAYADSPPESTWKGIEIVHSAQEIKLNSAVFRGAVNAISVVGSSIIIKDCLFERDGVGLNVSMDAKAETSGTVFRENRVGIEGNLRSFMTILENTFEDNEQFGLVFSNKAGGRVVGNRFRGGGGILIKQGKDVFLGNNTFDRNRVGIITDQVGRDVRISGSSFLGGDSGLQCLNFSTPWVDCCRFENLETAVLVQKFSNPMLANNLFVVNKVGVYANQKSHFPIKYNIFQKNERAVYIDLSSYPAVHLNNFINNTMDVVLGKYMSADWEDRVGSKNITLEEGRRSRSRNLGALQEKKKVNGVVDASHNWWGSETTAEMENAGAEGNISGIEDYFDKKEVSYSGFGEGMFKLDRVKYAPWKLKEIEEAGPKPGGCGDLEDNNNVGTKQ